MQQNSMTNDAALMDLTEQVRKLCTAAATERAAEQAPSEADSTLAQLAIKGDPRLPVLTIYGSVEEFAEALRTVVYGPRDDDA